MVNIMAKIQISDIREYQSKMEEVKKNGFTAVNFKPLARELRDKFNLTDRQAIDILLGHDKEILKILEDEQ